MSTCSCACCTHSSDSGSGSLKLLADDDAAKEGLAVAWFDSAAGIEADAGNAPCAEAVAVANALADSAFESASVRLTAATCEESLASSWAKSTLFAAADVCAAPDALVAEADADSDEYATMVESELPVDLRRPNASGLRIAGDCCTGDGMRWAKVFGDMGGRPTVGTELAAMGGVVRIGMTSEDDGGETDSEEGAKFTAFAGESREVSEGEWPGLGRRWRGDCGDAD